MEASSELESLSQAEHSFGEKKAKSGLVPAGSKPPDW
jgi:hypothetical protein